MRKVSVFGAIGLLALVSSSGNAATIVIDGLLDSAYGPAKSTVVYNPSAPTSNFGAPTHESNAIGYSIYLAGQEGYVYGFMQASGPVAAVGPFANVYFGINGSTSSVIGFETTNQNAFVPGVGGPVTAPLISFATLGQNVVEFAIPVAYFTGPIPGLSSTVFGDIGDNVTLRLSQSFGYSVAGGGDYGVNRLGTVELTNAVPEPSTWALMILGFAGLGYFSYRRTRRQTAIANAA